MYVGEQMGEQMNFACPHFMDRIDLWKLYANRMGLDGNMSNYQAVWNTMVSVRNYVLCSITL